MHHWITFFSLDAFVIYSSKQFRSFMILFVFYYLLIRLREKFLMISVQITRLKTTTNFSLNLRSPLLFFLFSRARSIQYFFSLSLSLIVDIFCLFCSSSFRFFSQKKSRIFFSSNKSELAHREKF